MSESRKKLEFSIHFIVREKNNAEAILSMHAFTSQTMQAQFKLHMNSVIEERFNPGPINVLLKGKK